MIFVEKSNLFRRWKNQKDLETPETVPRQVEISKDRKSKKCSGEKVFDHSNEVRNANFHNDHSYSKSSGINVDGVLSEGENAVEDLSQPVSAGEKTGDENLGNFHLRWEAIQKKTLQNGFLCRLLIVLVLLGLGRLSRGWNQTGNKMGWSAWHWRLARKTREQNSLVYLLFFISTCHRRISLQSSKCCHVICLYHRCCECLCLQDCYGESPVTMDTKWTNHKRNPCGTPHVLLRCSHGDVELVSFIQN